MKALKIAAIVIGVYVAIVVAFESMIGVFQPASESTIVITTIDTSGTAHERVVSALESGGQLYVAANHWPRAWYDRALENPDVQAIVDGETRSYTAVPVTGPEHDQVQREHAHGPIFRILTGFPPRYFLRLDPV